MTQTLPNPITGAMLAVANQNAGKPSHASMADWIGGVKGDDKDTATACVAVARSGGGANEPDYVPRTQAGRAALMSPAGSLMVDIARPRGWIAPNQPYVGNAAVPAAPVVSSIAPNTAAAGTNRVLVTVTGTGFSQWSQVFQGGNTVSDGFHYTSATQIEFFINPINAVPGTATVVVEDHDLMSNSDKVFTFT